LRALTEEGDVYTWGWGFDGRLGHFDNKDLLLPKRVTGLSQVVDISAGFGHMLAVTGTLDRFFTEQFRLAAKKIL
jgi:alpha-tubulin suppressor-like RCC1 family protein